MARCVDVRGFRFSTSIADGVRRWIEESAGATGPLHHFLLISLVSRGDDQDFNFIMICFGFWMTKIIC